MILTQGMVIKKNIFFPVFIFFTFFLLLAPGYGYNKYADPFYPMLPETVEARPQVTSSSQPPEVEEVIPAPELIINGILWGTDRPVVLIAGKIYEVGEYIDGSEIKIHAIEGRDISVLYRGKIFTMGTKSEFLAVRVEPQTLDRNIFRGDEQ